ncbi:DUF3422 family protein [Methylotuvimicrobium buryatense]|uniref:DUF3422 domain-containing protein n=1 Tax=Methylotuvimicrobium buryatense TaxID=95641 RepID=A0A4P9UT72_METBY|nr:DUF3422 domain-containing protein [Methylotuvimicrobium buryatense]QCW82956.1 DUF3422 domain-containing protein [Methylotuvimicrobium buryatense]
MTTDNNVTTLFPLPQNHPQRFVLHNEVHARASLNLELPIRASHLALLLTSDEKQRERDHLSKLCERYGKPCPENDASHLSETFDTFEIRWEQHSEFSTYTFYVANTPADPFSDPALKKVPVDWLSELPGQLMVAAHAVIQPAAVVKNGDGLDMAAISACFANNPVVGSSVTGGDAQVFTDFRIHVDGFSRFLIVDHNLRSAQAGRLLHRLFEIEVYRVMALLAFPIAKKLAPELRRANQKLYTITNAMAQSDNSKDAGLLDELTTLAAEIENHISTHLFRFTAASAYYQLVGQRLEDLREVRIQGIQTLGEFIRRRMEPAMNTCYSTSKRFTSLSERVGNASQLLRTRVDIVIERQNQGLLSSMARRAKMQFKMQQTVEGISIVAITYYATGLIGSVSKAARAAGWPVNPELAVGAAIPFVMIAVALGLKRIHKMIEKTSDE